MGVLSRIGVALDSDLLERFDDFISRLGYTNRSEAFRDLIRDRLVVERTASPHATVVGTVTLIYDHHSHGVTEKLTELQHAHHELVVSTSHAHLDHDACLEVLLVHGKSRQIEEFAGRLIGLKGVQHGRLVMTVAEPASAKAAHKNGAHKSGKPHSHKH
jgi:CopG family nickel-responsive transcriptional regulator